MQDATLLQRSIRWLYENSLPSSWIIDGRIVPSGGDLGQLRDKQVLFTSCLGRFLTFASENNYELTMGEAYRPDRKGHMPNSLHYERLAIDLNLFVDGKYIQTGDHPAWKALGLYWEGLHPLCRWGGRFNDANHLSIAYGGRA